MHSSKIDTGLRGSACRASQSKRSGSRSGARREPDTERYVGLEVDQEPGVMDVDRTIALFRQVSKLMTREHRWCPGSTADNPLLPAGYTYLAQLVSHDLFSGDGSATSVRDPSRTQNLRQKALRLETLYGVRPELDPIRFEHSPELTASMTDHWPRTRFRLDGIASSVADGSRDTSRGPRRDIPRIREVRHGRESGCPILADERNDDHAILSQMTVLFQLAHNAAMDLIECNEVPVDPLESANNFDTARRAITYAYLRIVRDDLLARLLDPSIKRYYDENQGLDGFFLAPAEDGVLTPDFLNAAYRFGHAMVRPNYRFNGTRAHNLPEIMRNTSHRGVRNTPLSSAWIVRWSNFFELTQDKPQYARRLSPKYVAALHNEQMFPSGNPHEPGGLAYRDLVRGATSGVYKVSAVAKRVADKAPELAEENPWIADAEFRAGLVKEWLSASSGIDEKSATEFVENPSPGVYYLIEAAGAHHGERLGPLGSIVLAETFYRALGDEDDRAALEAAASEIFGSETPSTMAEFVTWIDRNMAVDDKVFENEALPFV